MPRLFDSALWPRGIATDLKLFGSRARMLVVSLGYSVGIVSFGSFLSLFCQLSSPYDYAGCFLFSLFLYFSMAG